jgi:hypothetical protein
MMTNTYLHQIGTSKAPCFSCDGTGAFDLFDGLPCERCNGTGVHGNDDPGSNQQNPLRLTDESIAYFGFRALLLLPLRKAVREPIQEQRAAKETRK